ncbi:MAG: outer membrane protein assembly factor BamA [candidate division KSB1 bacterium]|nr:outer membrane protein assembly factor BamA [candidate division KSB1 bacterium]
MYLWLKMKVPVIVIVSIFWATLVYGQDTGVKILGLSVEGNQVADASVIRFNSGLSEGKEITAEDLQNAIKQLWSLKIFSDIQILLDREVSEGVYLTIKVTEYPRLEKIELEGNKKLKKKDIDEKLDFYKGQVISPWEISKAKKELKKLYAEKGYLLAEIETETYTSTEAEGRVILRFKIREGNKVQVKKIRFHGNEYFSDGKLRKQMKKTKEDRWWRGADFDQQKYQEDLNKVLEFYRNEGFRDAEILGDSLYYDSEKKDMFIDITVREGEKYQFGKITWEGNKLFEERVLQATLGFAEGDDYNYKKLQEAVGERLGGLYFDRGYIYATITPREKPVGDNRVDIHFLINEGEPAKVNKIHIAGNTKTKEKVIRRELRISPGDTFSREALQRSQREVWVLNYFSDVKVDWWPVEQDKIDLKFTVEEKSTDTANMSAGWSERDKVIGSIGVSMNNLFGNGQRLSFDWNFARSYRSFQISFTEPWLLDTPTLAGFSFYDLKREKYYQPFKERSRGGTFRIGRRLSWPDNYFRGDWIYRLDRTEYSDFEDWYREQYPYGIVSQKWPLTVSSFTQIISRNSLDRPEFPTQGSEFSLSTEVAGTILGGNAAYHKHILETNWFIPIFWKFVLYTHAQAGLISGFSKSSIIPPQEYFFMGGDGMTRSTPLRGYEDPWAGAWAVERGGKTMLKYTTELRFQIIPNPTTFGLVFAEAGNTWYDFDNTNPYSLRRSVGIGARIFMPMIGIIGFDYAYGFDSDPVSGRKGGGWKPHFVFGRGF